MSIDSLRITESTTRDELIAHIQDQQEEIECLKTRIEDKVAELEDLRLSPEQMERLADAADLMAGTGLIHNTPACKAAWIAGK